MSSTSIPLVTQPKFAEQLTNLPAPGGVQIPLQRGYMIWDRSGTAMGYSGGEVGDGRDVINFLFNPSTVTSDYNVMNTQYAANMLYTNPADTGNYMPTTLYQTVSFELYFDRMYELNYNTPSGKINDPAVIGVQADVYQFMQFTGVTYQGSRGQSANLALLTSTPHASQNAQNAYSLANGLGNQIMGTMRSSGLMMLIPSHVFFGNAYAQISNPSSSNSNAISSQMQYYGYISEWTVNYTHWTAAMVPIRCTIDVTFTMLSNPPVTNVASVWRDIQALGKSPYTVQTPYAPGYVPPTATSGSTYTAGG